MPQKFPNINPYEIKCLLEDICIILHKDLPVDSYDFKDLEKEFFMRDLVDIYSRKDNQDK